MPKPPIEKIAKDNLSDREASSDQGITSNAMRRRALAHKVVSRRLEREKALEQSKHAAPGVDDAPE